MSDCQQTSEKPSDSIDKVTLSNSRDYPGGMPSFFFWWGKGSLSRREQNKQETYSVCSYLRTQEKKMGAEILISSYYLYIHSLFYNK